MTDFLPIVERELQSLAIIDVHTHLFMPSLGALGLWGIDELLTYHYLGSRTLPLRQHHARSLLGARENRAGRPHLAHALRRKRAGLRSHPRRHRGAATAFGLSTTAADLTEARAFFAARQLDDHIDHIFKLAGHQRSRS